MLFAAFCEGKEVKLPNASYEGVAGLKPIFAALLTVLDGRLGTKAGAPPFCWGLGLARKLL
jgi:hypothetical protein